jgi:hypothetical protein
MALAGHNNRKSHVIKFSTNILASEEADAGWDIYRLQLNRKIATNRPGFCFYSQVFCNTEKTILYGTF